LRRQRLKAKWEKPIEPQPSGVMELEKELSEKQLDDVGIHRRQNGES
jgi:hypothetical protein